MAAVATLVSLMKGASTATKGSSDTIQVKNRRHRAIWTAG
jgi:hypothetical protein